MRPAAERLAAELERVKIAPPAVPVVSNVEAVPNQDPARVRELLVRQVTAPVRWEESVERIAALGVTAAVELGAGKVLTGLVKRIAKSITMHAAGDPESLAATAAALTGERDGQHG
jgi:[acyl-carrier-protein] S-malonyltransferase